MFKRTSDFSFEILRILRIWGDGSIQEDVQSAFPLTRRFLIFGIEKLSHFEAGQRDTRKKKKKDGRGEGVERGKRVL